MKKTTKTVLLLALAVVLLAFPFIGFSDYIVRVAIILMIYIIGGVGLNLISGEAGQVSMGQAGFFAVGAYASALLSLNLKIPVLISIVIATILSGIVAVLIGAVALRLSGGYLCVITLAFAEAIRLILINWSSLTNGNVGLIAIPRPQLFGITFFKYTGFYYLTLLCTILIVCASYNLIHSHFGLRLRMIKNDEIAAQTNGVNIIRDKVIAFSVSGLFAGLAGALYAHLMRFIDPTVGANARSNLFLCMVVLGGMGNMFGTIVAAIILGILPEVLRGFNEMDQLIYGLILIFAMLLKLKNESFSALLGRFFRRFRKEEG